MTALGFDAEKQQDAAEFVRRLLCYNPLLEQKFQFEVERIIRCCSCGWTSGQEVIKMSMLEVEFPSLESKHAQFTLQDIIETKTIDWQHLPPPCVYHHQILSVGRYDKDLIEDL